MCKFSTISWGALLLLLCGCAVDPGYDFWGIDYRSTEQHVGVIDLVVRADREIIYRQHSIKPGGELTHYHGDAYAGAVPRPTTLYVKWVDETSGSMHEQQMDLRNRLPESLDSERLILMFNENEAYLFAKHIAAATAGHPLRIVPSLQVFPDPAVRTFSGAERPLSAYN